MTPFTPEAATALDEYLRQVRAAVAGMSEVNPDEIEADVREHVATEFESAVRPVTLTEMEAVLVRLGPPQMWAAAGEPPRPAVSVSIDWRAGLRWLRRKWQGFVSAFWRGPEDWRLAYLAFGTMLIGIITLPIAIGVLLLFVSYLLGRAAAELAVEKQAPLGARRWLVYPPVLLFAVPLFLAVAFWPVVAAPGVVEVVEDFKRDIRRAEYAEMNPKARRDDTTPRPEVLQKERRILEAIPGPPNLAEVVAGFFAAAGALTLWWTLVGLTMWAFPRWPVVVFHPLLDGYTGGHGLRLAGVSSAAFLVWLGFAYRYAGTAGLL
jgi:hypothetical protein